MERPRYTPYVPSKIIGGNFNELCEVLNSTSIVFVFDGDGILLNSPDPVCKRFFEKTRIRVNPSEIDSWDYLTKIATLNSLSDSEIEAAEQGWYDPDTLGRSKPHLFARPIVRLATRREDSKVVILTARNPNLRDVTKASLTASFPMIPIDNLLMRDDLTLGTLDYKVAEIKELAGEHERVIFVDDSIANIKAVTDAKIENCWSILVPLGKITLEINEEELRHRRLVILDRHPIEEQGR